MVHDAKPGSHKIYDLKENPESYTIYSGHSYLKSSWKEGINDNGIRLHLMWLRISLSNLQTKKITPKLTEGNSNAPLLEETERFVEGRGRFPAEVRYLYIHYPVQPLQLCRIHFGQFGQFCSRQSNR